MGNSKSSYKIDQEALTKTVMEIMIKNSTTCKVDNKVVQRLQVRAGNGSIVSITNVSLDADIESKMICLISASTSVSEMTSITNKLKADLQQSNIKFPSLEKAKKNVKIKQKYVNEIKSAVNFENILKSLQSNMIDQSVVVQAGDNSTVVVDQTKLKAGMVILADIVNKQVADISRAIVAKADGEAALKASEVNALQPFVDLVGNIFDTLMNGYVMVMLIIAVVIIVFIVGIGKLLKSGAIKPEQLGFLCKLHPACRKLTKNMEESNNTGTPATGVSASLQNNINTAVTGQNAYGQSPNNP